MLDDHEFEQINAIYRQCIEAVQRERAEHERPLANIDLTVAFAPVLAVYNELTGFAETNPNAILHHRTALYGPACDACGRPLRSPTASFCAACGTRKAHG